MQIEMKVNGLKEIQNKIKSTGDKAQNTAPLMAELANHLYNVVDRSFEKQESPDGISWNPIKQSTHKQKNGTQKILYASGDMQDSLNQSSSNDSAQVGLNATKDGYPYPAVHQFGTKDGRIEARPFMPINLDGSLYDNIEKEIDEIVEDYMKL